MKRTKQENTSSHTQNPACQHIKLDTPAEQTLNHDVICRNHDVICKNHDVICKNHDVICKNHDVICRNHDVI